jgi:competence protein ComEC
MIAVDYTASWLRKEKCERYSYGPGWGVAFVSLLLFASVSRTKSVDYEGQEPLSAVFSSIVDYAGSRQKMFSSRFDELDLPTEEKAVLATISLGDKSGLKKETRRKFTSLGLAHLLAVSGFHVGVVAGMGAMLLFFLPERRRPYGSIKYSILILLIWLYAFVAGLSAATLRAAIMLSFCFLGKIIHRNTKTYNYLFSAALLMLAWKPSYLFDIGFQLSFAAVFSILYFHPRINRIFEENGMAVSNPILRYPFQALLVAISAQACVMGLAMYYFGEISFVFLLTAVPFSFLTSAIVPLSLIWLVMPMGSALSVLLGKGVVSLSGTMNAMTSHFLYLDFPTLKVSAGSYMYLIGYILLIAITLFIGKKYYLCQRKKENYDL